MNGRLPWTIPVLMMEPILEWVWFTIPVFTGRGQRQTERTKTDRGDREDRGNSSQIKESILTS